MDNQTLIAALSRAIRAFADELDASVETETPASVSVVPEEARLKPATAADGLLYDPESHAPPYAPDPYGDSRATAMCAVIFVGRLYAINRRKGRGASLPERRDIAKEAGYRDARAWNNWEEGNFFRDDDDAMWLEQKGHKWLLKEAAVLGIALPTDLARWVDPQGRG